MDDVQSKYVGVKEACTILSVSRGSLHNYVRAGKLRRFESGAPARVWFERSQIELLKRIRPKD